MGYGKTRQDVMKLVDSCLAKKEYLKRKSTKLSKGWWVRFLQRWPWLSLCNDSIAIFCEDASSYDVFKNYFRLLGSVLTEHGLKDKPSHVYDCDESGMPLEHKIPKVLSVKGTTPSKLRKQNSDHNSRLCKCYWASGASDGCVYRKAF